MTTTWDLRLLPVALAVWWSAVLTLLHGGAAGALCGVACAVVLPAASGAPRWGRWLLRRWRGRATASRARVPPAQALRGRNTPRTAGARAVTVLVVLLGAAASVAGTLAATAPARDFLTRHPPGSVVRVEATVTGAPAPYTSPPRPGEQEATRGVAVPLDVARADGAPAATELTVFTTHPGWQETAEDQRVDAVLTMTDTATPARLLARAASPPTPVTHPGTTGSHQGLVPAVRADLARLSSAHGPASAGLVPGMTVGDTSQLPEDLAQAMKDTGLTHLTAVSGSNCALVMTLSGYTALTLGTGRRTCLAVGLAALAGFVLLVGPDPSVLRAGVMGALGGIAMLTGRPGVSLNALCAAVTALVLTRPHLATDMGFVLSVLATAGIVVSARPVTRVLSSRLPTALAVCIAVPLVAQLWCGPALLLLNPDLPLYSLPANMAAAPLVPVVTVAGLLAVCVLIGGHLLEPALVWLAPGVPDPGAVTAWDRAAALPVGLASWPARTLAWIADHAAALPGARVPWPPGLPGILLLTAVTLAALAALHTADSRMRRPPPPAGTVDPTPADPPVPDAVWRHRAHRHRARRRLIAATTALTLALLLASAVVWWFRPAPAWESVVCDVGQGDAILHRTGEHSAVLVDGGPDPHALRNCLQQARITHLDAVIATHDHADHVAGLAGLASTVDVDRAWYSSADGIPPDELTQWAAVATRPTPGERLTAGPLTVEVLAPAPPAAGSPAASHTRKTASEDENNASLVLLLTLEGPDGPTTWLTAGDLEADGYRRQLRTLPTGHAPSVDVLKVSHHGARNGGTDIIHDTHPALAVISVGADNSYGHPHPDTVAALQEVGAAVARTDRNGALWIRRDGGRVVVSQR